MKKTIFIASMIFLASCQAKTESKTQSQINAKVDSLIGIKLEELNRQAMEDLDRRKSIEVKAKADSIVQAHMQAETASPTAISK
jgi:hypothetical protein